MGKKKNKKPKAAHNPKFKKVPRATDVPGRIGAEHFRWRVSDLDWDGSWGWHQVDIKTAFGTIVPKLQNYESMTWAEIEGPSGSHFVAIEALAKEAQARLNELEKDEQGQLFSLRVTGAMRIWGIRDVAIFRVLWCDSKHEVCPSLKKNT